MYAWRSRLKSECPPDIGEIAEKYHLGHLSPEEAAALEEHFLGCPRCTAEMASAAAYIAAMRAATGRLSAKTRRADLTSPK